jgi:hypothetical protein
MRRSSHLIETLHGLFLRKLTRNTGGGHYQFCKIMPGMEEVKVHDMRGSAFDMIERQSFEAAQREARSPTNIPEGELKEVKRYDQAGRVSYEFFGKPKVWTDTFNATNKKRLVGIRVANERGYHPSNVG